MRHLLDRIWEGTVGAGIFFGPLFMTNIGGSSKSEYLPLVGAALVSCTLLWLAKTVKASRADVGGTTVRSSADTH